MKKDENFFLIITENRYPTGDAGAVRLHAFAKIFLSLGYTPFVIGMGDTTNFTEDEFEGIKYYSLRYPGSSLFQRLKGRLFYSYNFRKLMSGIQDKKVNGILIDSGNKRDFSYVKQFAKNKGITLFYDAVEWYSPSEFLIGKLNRNYLHNNYLNTTGIDKSYKVFAISKYLENNFGKRDIVTLRIPVIMDVNNITVDKQTVDSSVIKIVYAGSPGTKDHICELVEAIGLLDKTEAEKIKFYVVGITREQYESNFGSIKNEICDKSVIFTGRVTREAVLEQLNTADFSFLLRPAKERYAIAGFPTKVVEGLATGTPILCNYSSDLELYLKDGENSIIIEDCSVDACVKALKRVVKLSRDDILRMQKSARKTAEEHFDWRLYVPLIKEFLDK